MYCTGEDSYKIILVFALLLSSLILPSNKKVTNWISTRILSEKYNFFDANFELTMCDFANGRVILKFNNPILVQKCSSLLLYSNLILNSYIVYTLNS